MFLMRILNFLLFFGLVTDGFPIRKAPSNLINFMTKYGYLENNKHYNIRSMYSVKSLSGPLKLVQKFGNIPQTGALDYATIQLLKKPRCGQPDKKWHRQKRFVTMGSTWKKRQISFKIENRPKTLSKNYVSKSLQTAFNEWSKHCSLTIKESSKKRSDIKISFRRGYHGDGDPFDGRGKVLAHALPPSLGGHIHFDSDELWVDLKNTKSSIQKHFGTDFYTVALHEIGHSLGLDHSSGNALMNPYYSGKMGLQPDDIAGIKYLYPEETNKITPDDEGSGDSDSYIIYTGYF